MKTETETNIHSAEFKERLKALVDGGDFPKDILFNGCKMEYVALTQEEQNELSKRFKEFVSENVISMMNDEVEFILNADVHDDSKPFTWDDVENLQTFMEDDAKDYIKAEIRESDNIELYKMELLEELETLEFDRYDGFCTDNLISFDVYEYEEQQEVYQWFLVTGWLLDKLKAEEEVVIESHNYWGRSGCGQSIELDSTFHNVFLKWWCSF